MVKPEVVLDSFPTGTDDVDTFPMHQVEMELLKENFALADNIEVPSVPTAPWQ